LIEQNSKQNLVSQNLPKPLKTAGFAEFGDSLFRVISTLFALASLFLIVWIGIILYQQSALTRHLFGWSILTGRTWDTLHHVIGALPFIYGTFVSSTIALILAVPIGICAAIFLSELAPSWLASPLSFLIELLAAIPSVIYGLWGVLFLCPWLNNNVYPWLNNNFGNIPLFSNYGGYPSTMLAAGIILAIMILPFITSVSREIIRSVPQAQREAALGLGATRWEMIRNVVLSAAKSGITGAVILALGRAIGETMAVVMVIGNNTKMSASLLQPGYTMPALLANEFNEAWTSKLHTSALLEIAFILFVITFIINALARILILLTSRNSNYSSADPGKATTMDHLRDILAKFWRWFMMVAIIGLVAWQIAGDLRSESFRGLLHPTEIIVYLYLATRIVTRLTRGTGNWKRWRKINNGFVQLLLGLCTFLACFILAILLYVVAVQGMQYLHPSIFTHDELDGGMSNGIIGTLVLVGIASVIGIPLGLIGGIYLSEYGMGRFGNVLRFSADVLNGIPSVVIGMFVYAAVVLKTNHFSAMAGGLALGIMMIPTIVRTTEEILRLTPYSLREGSLGLGATKFRTIRSIIVPAAKGGIVTGVMLALARVIGETAPLLFTAFGNEMVTYKLNSQISSLTMLIYRFAMDSDVTKNGMAWTGSLILITIVLVISLFARLFSRSRYSMH